MTRASSWRAAFGALCLMAAGEGWAQPAPPTYVWLFAATGAEVEGLTEMVTEEFEEALFKAGCLKIVRRRDLPELESHQQQELKIAGSDHLSPRQRRVLATATADAVVFGRITDDVEGGQVKIAVSLETLGGVSLADTSVRIVRGKRFDAEERERRMAELAAEVCGALGFAPRPQPPPDGPQGVPPGQDAVSAFTAEMGKVRYSVQSVRHTGQELQVWLVGTNEGATIETGIYFESSLWDDQGDPHRQTDRMSGGKRGGLDWFWFTLPHRTPTRFGLAFQTVPPTIRRLGSLRIRLRDQGWIEFHDIPVPYSADGR